VPGPFAPRAKSFPASVMGRWPREVLVTAYAAHPEPFPAHPATGGAPGEVWLNPPKTRATEEALLHETHEPAVSFLFLLTGSAVAFALFHGRRRAQCEPQDAAGKRVRGTANATVIGRSSNLILMMWRRRRPCACREG